MALKRISDMMLLLLIVASMLQATSVEFSLDRRDSAHLISPRSISDEDARKARLRGFAASLKHMVIPPLPSTYSGNIILDSPKDKYDSPNVIQKELDSMKQQETHIHDLPRDILARIASPEQLALVSPHFRKDRSQYDLYQSAKLHRDSADLLASIIDHDEAFVLDLYLKETKLDTVTMFQSLREAITRPIKPSFKSSLVLLKHGAPIEFDSESILSEIVYREDLSTINFLLKHGADPHYNNDEPFLKAAENFQVSVMKRLLKETETSQSPYSKDTLSKALQRSCRSFVTSNLRDYFPTHVLDFLKSEGADVDYADGTCIRIAVSAGDLEFVKRLVYHGAQIDLHQITFLTKAIRCHYNDVAQFLLSIGEYPQLVLNESLLLALKSNSVALIESLVSKGAQFPEGEVLAQAFTEASRRGSLPVIRYMVEHAADPKPMIYGDVENTFSLAQAAIHGYQDVVKYLLEAGLNKLYSTEILIECIKIAFRSGQVQTGREIAKHLPTNPWTIVYKRAPGSLTRGSFSFTVPPYSFDRHQIICRSAWNTF